MTLQCPANFLHFLQSENIGSPDGDPIRHKKLVSKSWTIITLEKEMEKSFIIIQK